MVLNFQPTAVIRWRDDRLGSRHFPNYSRRRRSTVLTVKRPVSKPCNVWKQGQCQAVAARHCHISSGDRRCAGELAVKLTLQIAWIMCFQSQENIQQQEQKLTKTKSSQKQRAIAKPGK